MGLSKLWGKDSSGNRGFVFSHIKTIYYNWAQKKLLSTKLDEMDSATNGKIDKTSIVQVESTSQTNVPSSAYLKTVKDALDGDISELNAKASVSLHTDNIGNGMEFEIPAYRVMLLIISHPSYGHGSIVAIVKTLGENNWSSSEIDVISSTSFEDLKCTYNFDQYHKILLKSTYPIMWATIIY